MKNIDITMQRSLRIAMTTAQDSAPTLQGFARGEQGGSVITRDSATCAHPSDRSTKPYAALGKNDFVPRFASGGPPD